MSRFLRLRRAEGATMERLYRVYQTFELWMFKGGPKVHALAFLSLCAFALLVQSLSSFQHAEWRLYDQGVRILRKLDLASVHNTLANEVVIIGIDEATFRALPEPFALWHGHIGRLLDAMRQAKPAVVGLDIVLPSQSYDSVVPGIDRQLMLPLLQARGQLPYVFAQTLDERLQARPIFPAYTALMEKGQLASALLCWDDDSVVRRQMSTYCTSQGTNEGLAARMAQVLAAPERGLGLIDFRRGSPFNYVPMHQVLALYQNNDTAALQALFLGKPVLVGLVLPFEDRLKVPTPIFAQEPQNSRVPGVMVHGQLLRSLLNGGLLKSVPQWLEWSLIIACCLCWFGYGIKKNIFYWTLFLLIPAASLYCLWLGHVLLPAALILAAKTSYVARQALEGRRVSHQRKRLTQAFAGHVNPKVLNSILHTRTHALTEDLKPRKNTAAVLVVRIHPLAGYSELSGQQQLTAVSAFYEAVKVAVQHADGMIDRLQGYEVTAWLGVPSRINRPEQAALEAALFLKRSFQKWGTVMKDLGMPVSVTIGVASGKLVSGQADLQDAHPFVVMGAPIETARALAVQHGVKAEQHKNEGQGGVQPCVVVRVCKATALAVDLKGLQADGGDTDLAGGNSYKLVLE